MQRATLRAKWLTLGEDEKVPFKKKTRDHLAKQELMKECITDALQKAKGGNCSRSYTSLAKVLWLVLLVQLPTYAFYVQHCVGYRGLVQSQHHHPLVAVETRLLHVHEED